MYYDRRLFQPLLDVLKPSGPLAWLVPLLRSDWGSTAGADLHFRGNREGHGYFEVYLGRTGPLRVRSTGAGLFLEADPFYARLAPRLFSGHLAPDSLAGKEQSLRRYLDDAVRLASSSLVDGEGRLQAMLGRAHGLLATKLQVALLLDREVVLGHSDMDEKRARNAEVRRTLALAEGDAVHDKLDGLALLADGRVALVELKAPGGDLHQAARQLVAYRTRFRELARQWNGWARIGLRAILDQKAAVGLLPPVDVQPLDEVVPVIASNDDSADWLDAWRRAIAPVQAAHGEALEGLTLWRLDTSGAIQEAHLA